MKFREIPYSRPDVDAMIEKILNDENTRTKTDPLGSYTGVAEKPYENVVQDADDL